MENNAARSAWNRLPLIEVFRRVIEFFGWRLFGGLILAILSLAFFGWLADEVFEGDTQNFDAAIRDYVHLFASPALTAAMKFFSLIGSPLVVTILIVFAVIVFTLQKHQRAIVLLIIGMAGELALDLSLKAFFRRPRPVAFFDYPVPVSYSFPSGHALGALCFYGILAWLITARIKNRAAKTAIWLAATLLIITIGLSRIYLGVHYPSDVIAGYSTGIFWIFAIALSDFWLHQRRMKAAGNAG